MIPVQDLLNRIRWDREFGKGEFRIGFYDNIEKGIISVALKDIVFEEGNHFSFLLKSSDGDDRTIPFHRVREIYKNGQLIWKRPEA